MSAHSRANIGITSQREINRVFLADGPDKADEFLVSKEQKVEVYTLEHQQPYEVYELGLEK